MFDTSLALRLFSLVSTVTVLARPFVWVRLSLPIALIYWFER